MPCSLTSWNPEKLRGGKGHAEAQTDTMGLEWLPEVLRGESVPLHEVSERKMMMTQATLYEPSPAPDCSAFAAPVMADPLPTTAEEAILAHHTCERARMKERDKKAHLLDWAESLLCNALPMSHCSQEEWDVAVKNWRDEKHGVKKPNKEAH